MDNIINQVENVKEVTGEFLTRCARMTTAMEDLARSNIQLQKQLEAKEAVIVQLRAELVDKEAMIAQQQSALAASQQRQAPTVTNYFYESVGNAVGVTEQMDNHLNSF